MIPIVHDVSAAQDPASVDWGRARDEGGCVGAFVRTEYGTRIDAAWHEHARRILAAQIALGVYTFLLPGVDPDDVVEALARELDPYALDYGVFVDVETRNHQAPGVVVSCALAICAGIDALGRAEPATGIYTGGGFWSSLGQVGTTAEVKARRLWIANYGASHPYVPHPWGGWKLPNGPVLWQAFGNTIWQNIASKEQRWGKTCPGDPNVWRKIASAYPTPYSAGELDTSYLPGVDDSPLRVSATAGGAAM